MITIVVCAWCHAVKNPDGTWNDFPTPAYEGNADGISHGACNKCVEKIKAEWDRKKRESGRSESNGTV